jgi:hypothetical protein
MRQTVEEAGFSIYDITWYLHHVNVDITNVEEAMGSPSSDQMAEVTQALKEALYPHEKELRILDR